MEDLTAVASPLTDAASLDALVERCAGRRVVLMGEASHGTHEYYRWRELLSRRLIAEHGFRFVAVEGDWPDCDRVDRAIRLRGDARPRDALDAFHRWPTWMWANEEVVDFAEWLRDWNAARPMGERAGFHGLDVYSLWDSLRAVLDWLAEHEPEEVPAATAALRCFEPYGEDPQSYAWATRLVPERCQDQVVQLLRVVRETAARGRADDRDEQARFGAERNAEAAAGAERYYRAMVRGGAASWNVRDRHMAATLDALLDHHGGPGIVWAHNTHVGDARATDMAAMGEVNLGQLARESCGADAVALVGFAGGGGSVIAADGWGEPMRRMRVPDPPPGTFEATLAGALPHPSLLLWEPGRAPAALRGTVGHRAIGVVYRPGAERGNYVRSVIADRYDALLWFPATEAVRPLHAERAAAGEIETWPSGR